MRTAQKNLNTFMMSLVLLGLTACGGPSKAGLEARDDAYNRIDLINTQIGYSQAQQAFETGQLRDSLELIEKTVDRYPEAAEYHLLHGRVLLELHRLDEALAAFESAVEQDEAMADAQYFMGIVHQRWSEDEEAFEHYLKATELDDTSPQYLLAAAEALVSLGRHEEAKALMHGRLKKFEHHPAFRHLLGQIAQLEGDRESAARLYEEASLLQPDDMQLLEELATAQFLAEQVPACLDTIQLLESSEHALNKQMTLLKARCMMQFERYTEARVLYRELRSTTSNDVHIWEEWGWLAWLLEDQRGLEEAGQKVTMLAPDRSAGWVMLSVIDRTRNALPAAEAHLQKAVECDDADSLAWVMLARIRQMRGDDTGADTAWTTAIHLDERLQDDPRVVGVIDGDG